MKIEQVKIQNFKLLKKIDFDLQGKDILITGENQMGKTSILQFIKIALGDTSNIPPDAEGSGMVVTNRNGDKFTFKVLFKQGNPVIEVTSPDGLKDTRKSALKSIVGAIDFDVDEFVKLSDSESGRKKQVELYKSLLDEETITALKGYENKVKTAYDDRTEFGRQIKTLEGFIKESPLWGEDLEIQPVDVSAVQEQLQKAVEHNDKIKGVKDRKAENERTINANNEQIEKFEKIIAELKGSNTELQTKVDGATKLLSTNAEIDTTALNQQIAEASEINTKANQAAELKAKKAQLERLEEQFGEMTVLIETTRQTIQDSIKDMEVPVQGLYFDQDQLLYKGTPVSGASLSYSEIAYLGLELKMAQNPDFGVLFIDNAESIGAKRMKEIQELAKAKDWQIIMAQVNRGQEELKIEIIGE